MDLNSIISLRDASIICGLSPDHLRRLAEQGKLDAKKIGGNWYKAQEICLHLSEDGITLTNSPLNIWRLPTVDEAVRSMAHHGQNSGGAWDPQTSQATYLIPPDKESPYGILIPR